MKWLSHITGGYRSSAKVAGNALVLSLPDALSPSVWRMDLDEARSAAIEVQGRGDGTHALVLKAKTGAANDIAVFAERAGALRALMAVGAALEQAPVSSAAPAAHEQFPSAPPEKKGGVLAGIVGVILLAVLVAVLLGMGPRPPGGLAPQESAGTAEQGTTAGSPVSADDFLRNR